MGKGAGSCLSTFKLCVPSFLCIQVWGVRLLMPRVMNLCLCFFLTDAILEFQKLVLVRTTRMDSFFLSTEFSGVL